MQICNYTQKSKYICMYVQSASVGKFILIYRLPTKCGRAAFCVNHSCNLFKQKASLAFKKQFWCIVKSLSKTVRTKM